MELIERNYKENITLSMVAKKVNFSAGYFSRYFKEKTGENFYSYLSHIRLSHAMEEMKSKNLTSLECAMNNGFPNVKAFIETFKKIYDCTPSEYKKRYFTIVIEA